jgi:hypothetical protein
MKDEGSRRVICKRCRSIVGYIVFFAEGVDCFSYTNDPRAAREMLLTTMKETQMYINIRCPKCGTDRKYNLSEGAMHWVDGHTPFGGVDMAEDDIFWEP